MPIDLDEYRAQSREGWARVSPAWEDRREWMTGVTAPVFDWLVAKADPQPGQTFLDVAGGIGDLGLMVADAVGADGRVILTDFSPEMVEAARRNGEAAEQATSSTACSTRRRWTSRTTASTARRAGGATC